MENILFDCVIFIHQEQYLFLLQSIHHSHAIFVSAFKEHKSDITSINKKYIINRLSIADWNSVRN